MVPGLISPPAFNVWVLPPVASGGVNVIVGGSTDGAENVTVTSRLVRFASLCASRNDWKTRSFTVRTLCLLMNASQLGAAIELNIPMINAITTISRRVNPPSPFLDAVLWKLGLGLAAELCKNFNNIGGVFMVLSYCLSGGCCWEICRFIGIIISISLNATKAISSERNSGYVFRCINTSVKAIYAVWRRG